MGFLDNSGDIILDAVLTDTGRKRLAAGNGSFQIAKFALGDDEINYGLYDKSHSSGSAYYDLEILQTPVLEAFTNNASSMKSKLMTISRTNHLYLPTMKMRNADVNLTFGGDGIHYILTDEASTLNTTLNDSDNDLMDGFKPADGNRIAVHQGIDNTAVPASTNLPSELEETQYIVEIDNRLGSITDRNGNPKRYSFLDDDGIATYYFTKATDSNFVEDITSEAANKSPIAGARGTKLVFCIQTSLELQTSNYLFDLIGLSSNPTVNTVACRAIDSIVRVTGATTGNAIDVPVRFIKEA